MSTVPREYKAIEQDEGKRKKGEYPWDYYLRRSQEITAKFKDPIILKMDADNEACDLPIKGGIAGNLKGKITVIEYDLGVLTKARINLPKLTYVNGDIRHLPFPDETFDFLIDCSTLDHIHPRDVLETLKGYNRVLKKNGSLLLFDWVTNNPKYAEEYKGYNTWSPTHQYYHPESEVDFFVSCYFDIKEKDHFWSVDDIHMNFYLGLKKG